MFFHVLLLAFGILLIVEGVLPAISPSKYKEYLKKIIELPDESLQKFGFVLILIGLFIIFIV